MTIWMESTSVYYIRNFLENLTIKIDQDGGHLRFNHYTRVVFDRQT